MSFAIEVAGEASPLSLQELFRVLQAASSYDNSQRQSAAQQLSAWEAIPDYYPGLQVMRDLFVLTTENSFLVRDAHSYLENRPSFSIEHCLARFACLR